MMKNKKAEGVHINLIIGLILTLIIAFVIIFFIRRFQANEFINRETCHQSVLLRSMPSVLGDSAKQAIPLKCKTENIVINSKDENLIKEAIATSMYDCWSMLGEGRLDFFTESTWQQLHASPALSACVICSTINFDEKTQKAFDSVDITDYLKNVEVPTKGMKYLQYFTEDRGAELGTGYKVEPLKTSKEYVVLYKSIKGDSVEELLKTDAGLAVGGLFIASGFKGMPGVGSITNFFASKAGAIALLSGFIVQELFVIEREWVAAGHCDGNTKGCNFVILTEFDKESIEKNCNNIEGIP